jgi:hypothetical protein
MSLLGFEPISPVLFLTSGHEIKDNYMCKYLESGRDLSPPRLLG